jgi:26S proteasome regulatory subunit N9
MKRYAYAVFLLRIAVAEKKLALGKHHDCLEALKTISAEVERFGDMEAKVYQMLAHTYGLYYQRREDHENYYKSCITYLAYTPTEEMTAKEQQDFSIKIGLSILLGKNVFNISELLDKDVITSLVGTPFEWLYTLMRTLGHGQIAEFEAAFNAAQGALAKFPNILKEQKYLSQKVRIIAFLELIFDLGKDERSVPFERIASACQIEMDKVEYLLIKSMSLLLVRGTIDEVDQVVHIDWAMPRYLSKEHLQKMHSKMEQWEDKMNNVIGLCESQALELMHN